MKNITIYLLLFGCVCMALPLALKPIILLPEMIADFLRGFGFAFILCAPFVPKKWNKK